MKPYKLTYEYNPAEKNYDVILECGIYDGDLNMYIPANISYTANHLPIETIEKFQDLFEER